MSVPHHGMEVHLWKREFPHQLLTKEHHSCYPEEQNIMTCFKELVWVEYPELWRLCVVYICVCVWAVHLCVCVWAGQCICVCEPHLAIQISRMGRAQMSTMCPVHHDLYVWMLHNGCFETSHSLHTSHHTPPTYRTPPTTPPSPHTSPLANLALEISSPLER